MCSSSSVGLVVVISSRRAGRGWGVFNWWGILIMRLVVVLVVVRLVRMVLEVE